jgi:hypothetical protein
VADKTEARIDAEWRDDVLGRVLPEVRERVSEPAFRAFIMRKQEGLSYEEIGPRVGMRPASARVAVCLVLRVCRTIADEMNLDYPPENVR